MKRLIVALGVSMVFISCFASIASDSVNSFAFDLYKVLAKETGNIFFSPFSLNTALAMTYLGADKNTAEQMKKVLHFQDEGLHESFSELIASLNQPTEGYQLSVANALWVQKDYPLLPSFLEAVEKFYKATVDSVDFVLDPQGSVRKINEWIEQKTEGKIKDMLREDDVDELTRVILTNAIYFKGNWRFPFDPQSTKKDFFFANKTEKIEVDMMKQTREFQYFEDEKTQILKLPYADSTLSMIIVLPKESATLKSVEEEFTKERFETWYRNLSPTMVRVFLPRFKIMKRLELKRTLMSMGMVDAFTDAADFSKMDGTHMLKIQNVIHQAFVEVNEEGTEAAAATAVIVGIKAAPQPKIVTFRVDRPFIFFIHDDKTNVILFMGRLQRP